MTYSSTWDETTPAGSEAKSLGDNRIREFKNQVRERMEDALVVSWSADPVVQKIIPVGTKMVFCQAAAPTGWTQDTSQNDKALRIVNSTGGGTGGTLAFSATTTGNHTLTVSEMAAHDHGGLGGSTLIMVGGDNLNWTTPQSGANWGYVTASSQGGGTGHNHPLAFAYVDVIVCAKN